MNWAVVALCLLTQAIATPVQMLDDRGGTPSAWARMSPRDKTMSKRQAEVSHFTGSMSTKERSFAEQQGAERELFALTHQEHEMARRQTVSRLGKKGEKTLRYLTTPDKVSASDLRHLDDIRHEAVQRTKQLEKDLSDLQAPVRRQEGLGRSLRALRDTIAKNMHEDQKTDLGEGVGMSAGKHERVQKAEEKARIEMSAETKRHQADIKTFRRV